MSPSASNKATTRTRRAEHGSLTTAAFERADATGSGPFRKVKRDHYAYFFMLRLIIHSTANEDEKESRLLSAFEAVSQSPARYNDSGIRQTIRRCPFD